MAHAMIEYAHDGHAATVVLCMHCMYIGGRGFEVKVLGRIMRAPGTLDLELAKEVRTYESLMTAERLLEVQNLGVQSSTCQV